MTFNTGHQRSTFHFYALQHAFFASGLMTDGWNKSNKTSNMINIDDKMNQLNDAPFTFSNFFLSINKKY